MCFNLQVFGTYDNILLFSNLIVLVFFFWNLSRHNLWPSTKMYPVPHHIFQPSCHIISLSQRKWKTPTAAYQGRTLFPQLPLSWKKAFFGNNKSEYLCSVFPSLHFLSWFSIREVGSLIQLDGDCCEEWMGLLYLKSRKYVPSSVSPPAWGIRKDSCGLSLITLKYHKLAYRRACDLLPQGKSRSHLLFYFAFY